MGFFSWCCKGCDDELTMGEYVRLDGRKQVYDGYGGSAAQADYYDPVAWHQRCYNKATTEQKLDETPSKSADNQGMGFPKLVNMQGYDETAKTVFNVVVYCTHWGEEERQEWQFHLTPHGFLDENEYQKRLEEAYRVVDKARPDNYFEIYNKATVAERDAMSTQSLEEANKIIGYPAPRLSDLEFNTIAEALAAVEPFLSKLPPIVEGRYKLAVFGDQGEVSGVVYEREFREAIDKSGGWRDWKHLGYNETVVTYNLENPEA